MLILLWAFLNNATPEYNILLYSAKPFQKNRLNWYVKRKTMPHKNIDETIEFQTQWKKMYEIQIYERLWKINAMINGVYKLLYLFQPEETIEMYIICCRLYFSLYTYNCSVLCIKKLYMINRRFKFTRITSIII